MIDGSISAVNSICCRHLLVVWDVGCLFGWLARLVGAMIGWFDYFIGNDVRREPNPLVVGCLVVCFVLQ